MAVNMNSVNAYNAYQNSYNNGLTKDKKSDTVKDVKAAELPVTNGQKQLSQGAQTLLERLRSEHSDKDIMVADFDKGDDAKAILARGTKEFSVLFSSEELEKMAADEKYYEEKMSQLDGALRMSEEINAKYGFERGFGKDAAAVTKVGISFNSDGTTTLFAELEKVSEKQAERIEKAREEKSAEADKVPSKKVMLTAGNEKDLLAQMNAIDWSKVKENAQKEGSIFDFIA